MAEPVCKPHFFKSVWDGGDALRLPVFTASDNMAYVHKAQSPYSVNMLAAMAARIAVQDRKFVEDYVTEILAAQANFSM